MQPRRLILVLYVLAAGLDTTAKTLAADATLNRALTKVLPSSVAYVVQSARRPAGNFELFRAASRRLVHGEDLYMFDPDTLLDRFKYSPTFALLFAPLAWIPWPVALLLWSLLNAVLLFIAVNRLLPEREACIALICLLPEVVRSMQNAQSNALVAALIILAFLAIEHERPWRAAVATMLGACIKIFPLAALTFAIPRRMTIRTGLASAFVGLGLGLLPLLVTSPPMLVAQYRWWMMTEAGDAQQRWFSMMELLHRWLGMDLPNLPVQLAGTVLLLAPMVFRRDRWADRRFRTLFLCSALVYVTLFNHQAERSSYLIAFTGATIWFVSGMRTPERALLFAVAMITIPVMSTLLPVPYALRSPPAMLYRLCLPTLAIWIVMQWDLLKLEPRQHHYGHIVEAAA